jgi:outer membrane lipoprotein-sorting protein
MIHRPIPTGKHPSPPGGGTRSKSFFTVLPFLLIALAAPSTVSTEARAEVSSNTVLSTARQMRSSFQAIDNYSCEVENIYFFGGVEEKRYHLRFHFKSRDLIRMDFIHPFEGMTIFYQVGDKDFTVRPIPAVSAITFRFSVSNPLFKSPSGQRLDQTSIDHFLDFLFKNLRTVKQGDPLWKENAERVVFWFWGKDYIEGQLHEKYQITISKKFWLPLRFERYDLNGVPQEITVFSDYRINEPVGGDFFKP